VLRRRRAEGAGAAIAGCRPHAVDGDRPDRRRIDRRARARGNRGDGRNGSTTRAIGPGGEGVRPSLCVRSVSSLAQSRG
jgi:hypothetical protein